ncbi:MAG: rRNA ((1518)-N(6)/adenine(1519)-N(6))-dimethyltransferase RsmA [Actinomycetota bacterium]
MTESKLLGASEIRRLAAEIDVKPTKVWGQNFVIDANTVRSIVRAAGIDATSDVVEVGPGLGSLTLALLETAHTVTAIEIDPKLAARLPLTVAEFAPESQTKMQVIQQDAMQVTELSIAPTALVANLPYNVSVPVLLHLLKTFPSIKTALVMVQAEVAERLAAKPGSRIYGVPSVKAAWLGEARKVATIGRNVFWPAPNVDSALIRIDRHPKPLADVEEAELFAVIDAAFSQRRKMLRSALATWAGSSERATEILLKANVDPTLRGEALNIQDFIRIAEAQHA